MFRFASPYSLLLLALVPLIIYYRRHYYVVPALSAPSLFAVRSMPRSVFIKLKQILPILKYLALVLMIIALARPQWGTQKVSVVSEGVNIMLAVDLSGSMAALDFKYKGQIINRLEAVKLVVKDFVKRRSHDRIGLVVFGSEAYTQLPLTRDYHTIMMIMDRLEIGAAGPNTAIGDAIGVSLKRLTDIESQSNVIILLTDGRSNAGELSPSAAAEIAVELQVKIYTIGVGTQDKEVPIPVHHPVFGERYVYERIDIDEEALKKIARDTGGLYFSAQDFASLEKIYEVIDRMEKTEAKVETFDEYREYYLYLMIPAFVLLCLWVMLVNTRFLSIP